MTTPAIEIAGLRKVFRLYPDLVRSRIKQGAFFWNTYYREKIALDDINLRVERGEIVGVIGANGAGKTTLLKIIAGISYPTAGHVKTNGAVVAVLALGLGFHSRLTGLENIDLAGMMLGMSRQEVRRKRDWIIEFSELGKYIESPLTSYSSGMRARLSFAVAACQDPEILIVDEALATGDIRFVQKCIGRIHEITQSGTTALFVSHNIWSVKRLTNRCILIDDGRLVEDGESGRVTDRYYEFMLRGVRTDSDQFQSGDGFVGTGEVKLTRADLRNSAGASVRIMNSGERGVFLFELDAGELPRQVALRIVFRRADGISATMVGTIAGGVLNQRNEFEHPRFAIDRGLTTMRVDLNPLLLAPGEYSIDLHIVDPDTFSGFTTNEEFFFKTRVMEFEVRRFGNPNHGIIYYQPALIEISEWGSVSAD